MGVDAGIVAVAEKLPLASDWVEPIDVEGAVASTIWSDWLGAKEPPRMVTDWPAFTVVGLTWAGDDDVAVWPVAGVVGTVAPVVGTVAPVVGTEVPVSGTATVVGTGSVGAAGTTPEGSDEPGSPQPTSVPQPSYWASAGACRPATAASAVAPTTTDLRTTASSIVSIPPRADLPRTV